MSLKSIFAHIKAIFSSDNLNAIEKFVSVISPKVATDLAAFMDTLPSAFASLETAAEKAVELVKDVAGITISKSLAISVAQNIFGAKFADIVTEAEEALKAIEGK